MSTLVRIKSVYEFLPDEHEARWRKAADLIREHMGSQFSELVAPMLEAGAESLAADLPRQLDLLEMTCSTLERRIDDLRELLEEYRGSEYR